jgi:predicted DNA-binding WGR domain protein
MTAKALSIKTTAFTLVGNMEYKHIAWRKDEKTNTDKVWGVICLEETVRPYMTDWGIVEGSNGKYLIFWGRRGKKLQTKLAHHDRIWLDDWVEEMFSNKLNKGYKEVDKQQLNEVYPEFQQDLEKTAFWATFKI